MQSAKHIDNNTSMRFADALFRENVRETKREKKSKT